MDAIGKLGEAVFTGLGLDLEVSHYRDNGYKRVRYTGPGIRPMYHPAIAALNDPANEWRNYIHVETGTEGWLLPETWQKASRGCPLPHGEVLVRWDNADRTRILGGLNGYHTPKEHVVEINFEEGIQKMIAAAKADYKKRTAK